MSEERIGAYATATVNLRIPVTSSWGPECSVSQVWRQAADEVKGIIRNELPRGVVLVGEPEITAVMAPRKS